MVELHIEPLCKTTDLLLGIGLILLGLCILAIIITVEICYFRKGAAKHDAARNGKKRKAVPDTRRSFRSAWLQAIHYKLASKGRPFQTWVRCVPYGYMREDTATSVSALAQVRERSRAH